MTNRSVRFAVGSALGLLLAAGSGVAFAQAPEGAPPAAPEGAPPAAGAETAPAPASAGAGAGPLLTLRQGGVSVDGDVVVSLSSGAVGKPVQIVPNVYYGISDQLSVGIAHNPGAEVFQTAGRGLCLTGTDSGCLKFYNNISLDALFSFLRDATKDLAIHGGIDFLFLDPLWASLRVGVKGKMLAGPLVIVFDPSINIGLSKRDEGNKEALQIPVRIGFMATPELNLGLSVGLIGPLDGFGDSYRVPLGFGGSFALSSQLALRAQFTLDRLIAANDSGADARTLSVGAAWHM